ncbi:MAG: hypothetical protein LBC39_08605 [Methanobrevibacter sp.]|nr:hypothetical protein [Candidatus Methanovirga aequatorialis]
MKSIKVSNIGSILRLNKKTSEFNINSSRFIFNVVKEMYECDRDLIRMLTSSPKVNYFLNRKTANMYLTMLKQIHPFLRI